MKLIYVSGPMTPTVYYPDLAVNRKRLQDAGRCLFEQGHAVIVPVFTWLDHHQPYIDQLAADKYGPLYDKIVKLDVELLRRCDAIYLLRGWTTSRGATIEHDDAVRQNKEIIFEL